MLSYLQPKAAPDILKVFEMTHLFSFTFFFLKDFSFVEDFLVMRDFEKTSSFPGKVVKSNLIIGNLFLQENI